MKAITPRPVDWIDTAPLRVVETVEIEASADDVFAIVVDHEAWPEWFDTLDSVTKTDDVAGVGGHRRVSFSGITVDEEFLEWEQGRRFGFTVTHVNRPVVRSLNERVDIVPLGETRCRLTYVQGFDLPLLLKPLSPVLRGQFAKGLRDGLSGLKRRAESG